MASLPPVPESSPSLAEDAVPYSPLQKIISRLPSPISIKRVSLTSPTSSPSPSSKRQKANDSNVLSSPDMRRQILVKKVKQKLSSGVTISVVGSDVKDDVVELDNSIEIITDTNDNDSLTLEERDTKNTKCTEPKCEDNINKNKPINVIEDRKPVENKVVDVNKAAQPKTCSKEKKVEIQWTNVKRNKRKVRFFIFGSKDKGEKDEVTLEKAENNQKVPRVINGRRPYIVVPGVEYELEEGEGLVMDTEEDETEIRLARNEKYEMDSFVCDTGYLSDEEMVETPSVDKVISKVKQQRRANNIQAKLKFEKMGEPEVIGCLWWSGKGGQKIKMRKWQAIIFTSFPIATTFTTQVPEDQCTPSLIHPPPPPPVQSLPSTATSSVPDYATKYHVKYLVKSLVHKAMLGCVGPNQCSTPMPGKQNYPKLHLTQPAIASQVVDKGEDILRENKELLDRYVTKYYNKIKYQM